jgi:hypothetical protein
MPVTAMAPDYCDYIASNYALASGSYRDRQSVASWVNSTRHAPQHDDDYQMALLNIQDQTGYNALDASMMPTSTGMEIAVSHAGFGQCDEMYYAPEQTFPGLSLDCQLDASYPEPGQACYAINPLDSMTYPDNHSPPLTVATTASSGSLGSSGSAGAATDDFLQPIGFNFEESMSSLPPPAINCEPIQRCEYLGESKLKMYR